MQRLLCLTILVISLYMIIWPSEGLAKNSAYFIGSGGKIMKLDMATNETISLELKVSKSASLNKILGADIINNYLYITHCARREPCKVGMYGLKSLEFIKELPIDSMDPDIKMIIYPDGSKFLIQHFVAGIDGKDSGYTTDQYDAKAITQIKNLNTIFSMKKVTFSKDLKKMYSLIGGAAARVDIIDTTTFEVLGSRDLTKVWRKEPEVFASTSDDIVSDKILISECKKMTYEEANNEDLYVYDIETEAKSPKISTGLEGNMRLTPDAQNILFDETETLRFSSGMYDRERSLGRLHIYSVASGQELGLISSAPKEQGRIRGISPTGDRLYYQAQGDTEETTSITVMDIKNFSVITTINVPFRVLSMIFFEE